MGQPISIIMFCVMDYTFFIFDMCLHFYYIISITLYCWHEKQNFGEKRRQGTRKKKKKERKHIHVHFPFSTMRFLFVVLFAAILSTAAGFCRLPASRRTFSIVRYRGEDNEKVDIETTSEKKQKQLQNTAVVTGAVVGFVYWYYPPFLLTLPSLITPPTPPV